MDTKICAAKMLNEEEPPFIILLSFYLLRKTKYIFFLSTQFLAPTHSYSLMKDRGNSPFGTPAIVGLLLRHDDDDDDDDDDDGCGAVVGMKIGERSRNTRRKHTNIPRCHFVQHKSHMTCPGF
jgi:hypothetical protein